MISRTTTGLIDAIKSGDLDEVAMLLPRLSKITLNMSDRDGKTPLHHAIEMKDIDMVEMLLMQGADIYAPSNNIGTPLALAINMANSIAKSSKVTGEERAQINEIMDLVALRHQHITDYTHSNIINFIKAMGYKSFDQGVCYGVAAMGAQAAMLGKEAVAKFNDRIQLINRLYNLYSGENGIANEFLKKLENLRDPNLPQTERSKILASMKISQEQYNDLNAFFQSVDIYANSQDYSTDRAFKGLFQADQHPIIQDLEIPSQFLWEGADEGKFIKKMQTFTTDVNSDHNADLLAELGRLICESDDKRPVTVMVNNERHAISFTFNPETSEWICADAGTSFLNDNKTKLLLNVPHDSREFLSGFIQHAYKLSGQKPEAINFTCYCEAEVGKELKKPSFLDKFTQSQIFKKCQEASLAGPDQTSLFNLSVQYSDGETMMGMLHANKKLINSTYQNMTPVTCAASNDDVSTLEKLMTFKPNINKAVPGGNTPLQTAALYNCCKALQFLIKNKASIDLINNKYFNTALHYAAYNDSLEAAEILIKHQASLKSTNKDSYTPLHMATYKGSINVARLLIENKANVNQKTIDNETCLHLAAKYGHTDMAKLLLDNGANINVKDKNGATPLHLAAASPGANNSNTGIIALLVKCGCNINEPMEHGRGFRPIHCAIISGNNQLLAELIKCGADIHSPAVDPKAKKGSNKMHIPLHLAIEDNQLEAVSILLEHGADPMALNEKGESAIAAALKSKYPIDMMRHILIHAIKTGNIDLASKCIDKCAFLVTDATYSPILHAVELSKPDMIMMLIQKGATIFDMTSQGGCTIDMVKAKNPDLAESMLFAGLKYALKEKDSIKDFFANNRLSVNQCDKDGNTPLHHAISCDNLDVIKKLLKAGADINLENMNGETPLLKLAEKMQDDNINKYVKDHMPDLFQKLTSLCRQFR